MSESHARILSKTIRLIGRKHFEIRLIQHPDGTYTVESTIRGYSTTIGPFIDYSLADHAFEQELVDLEGH
jgi:hypothetical protein